MEFKFNINTASIEKDLHEKMTAQMRNALESSTKSFFSTNKTMTRDNQGKLSLITEKGDGIKEIDDMIANKFLDPKFKESMDKFFDHNWERIFEECMTRAIQHKANGISFNKMHTLPPINKE